MSIYLKPHWTSSWKLKQPSSNHLTHLSTRYVNKNYNQAYFGVTESQAAQTNFTAYLPGGGFKDVGALLGVHYKLSKKLFLGAKGGGYYLLGDAVDSSIVKQKYGLIAVTGLLYKF